jgi:hypothetical protein
MGTEGRSQKSQSRRRCAEGAEILTRFWRANYPRGLEPREDRLGAFKQALRRTPFYGAYKALGHHPDYWYWHLRGRPVRAPHLLKQRTVRAYGAQFGLGTLVEAGTYYGEMVAAARRHFRTIYSIESDKALALRATRKFSRYDHIHIVQGDSKTAIPAIVAALAEPALFWLDAGYYGWNGVVGDRTRLDSELDAILGAPLAHFILLDDARGLNGMNGAPTVEQLTRRIERQFPGRRIEVRHDILRIVP